MFFCCVTHFNEHKILSMSMLFCGAGEGRLRRKRTARAGGASGQRERAARVDGASGRRKRAAQRVARSDGVQMERYWEAETDHEGPAPVKAGCSVSGWRERVARAGSANGRREWTARAGGASGRRERAAR